jgi:hypothetical protein
VCLRKGTHFYFSVPFGDDHAARTGEHVNQEGWPAVVAMRGTLIVRARMGLSFEE